MIPFNRDRFTWLAYLMLGYYAYMQATAGPLMTYLGDELQLNYVQRGLHFSGFALGMVLAGSTADRLAKRLGRAVVFWIGGFGMGLSALMQVFGQSSAVTTTGAFLMGYIGSWTLVMIQSLLADRHGDLRTIALTEANVIASVGAMIAPALIGILATNWRGALLAGLGTWFCLFIIFRQVAVPLKSDQEATTSGKTSNLPKIFWLYWAMGILTGSIEWSVIFWAADFLERVVGLPKNYATGAVSAYFVANVIGRAVGSRVARVYAAETLLFINVVIAAIGFPIFWLASTPMLNITGLFITGLGVSNLYPFLISLATRVAHDQSDKASARTSMAMGIAILVTPQILASFADQMGIFNAYTIVIVLLVILLVLTIIGTWLVKDRSPQVSPR